MDLEPIDWVFRLLAAAILAFCAVTVPIFAGLILNLEGDADHSSSLNTP